MAVSMKARHRANVVYNAVALTEWFINSGLTISCSANKVVLLGNKGPGFVLNLVLTEIAARASKIPTFKVSQDHRILNDGSSYSRVEVTF